jgi:hypothetical protein
MNTRSPKIRDAKPLVRTSAVSGRRDSPLDPRSEAVMEQLLALLLSMKELGLADEAEPYVDALMKIVYDHGKRSQRASAGNDSNRQRSGLI